MSTQNKIDPLLVDEKTAAKLLGVCSRTLFNLRRDHGLPFVKIGVNVRYCVDSLKEFIGAREQVSVTVASALES